jgi:DmsE family decaheme c-type cytochrome
VAPAAPPTSDSENCAACHDEALIDHFDRSIHGRLEAFEVLDGGVGCESCHGAADEHMGSADPADIKGLKGDLPEDINAVCTRCHSGGRFVSWAGSEHMLSGVGCTDCHEIHPSGRPDDWKIDDPRTCYRCHEDVRAEMYLPSHHPVKEGKMTCLACHEPHGSTTHGLRTEERPNDLCLNCHSAYQGPFVFEHAPVVEDCGICHTPHGAPANNLLVQTEPFLCLQCHEFHFHAALEGRSDDPASVGDPGYEQLWDNPNTVFSFKAAFTTKCTQCHSHVHGSDLPSQSLPGQGKSFTR